MLACSPTAVQGSIHLCNTEVISGAICSLLQVLLAKVHMHQFISEHQFVKASQFCLYFKSESCLPLVYLPVYLRALYPCVCGTFVCTCILCMSECVFVCVCVLHLQLVHLSIINSLCLCLAISNGSQSPSSKWHVCVCVFVGVCVCADCLICCCRAVARGLQWISFIRLIREEERSDGRWEGAKNKDGRRMELCQVNTPQVLFDPNI